MELRNYFKTQFPNDFMKMKFKRDPFLSMTFFGGNHWENFEQDTKYINDKNKKSFIKALFLTQLVQSCVHCYYRDFYNEHYKTMPVFGYCGFGPHHIKMKTLLEVPTKHGIVFNDTDFTEMAQDFFDQCLVDCEQLGINYAEFLSKIYNDREFRHARKENQEQFSKFVAEFDKIYQESWGQLIA